MKYKTFKILIFSLLAVNIAGNCSGEGETAISLGYPYVGVKHNLSRSVSLEGRYAAGSGINVFAGRVYWNSAGRGRDILFTGLELGGISFNTYDIKGSGFEGGIFGGLEHFISDRISLLGDFYPVFIALKSDDYRGSGIEFVVNFGFNFYFGETGKNKPPQSAKPAGKRTIKKNKPTGKKKR